MPPIVALGSPELQKRVVMPVLQGDMVSALAITEPSGSDRPFLWNKTKCTGGSDVANLRTKATRDGSSYILSGTRQLWI